MFFYTRITDPLVLSPRAGGVCGFENALRPVKSRGFETNALKLVGMSFLALAAYVAFDAVKSLVRHEPPEASYVGIALAVAGPVFFY